MTITHTSARHRAPRRALRPSILHRDIPTGRGLAAAASSGLLITMVATSATAVEQSALATAPVEARGGDVSVSTEALTALAVSPVVRVPADVAWAVDAVSVSSKPAPEPEPEPEPAVASTSRSSSRAATATAAQPAAAAKAAPAPSASSSAIVDYARQFVGVPYVWGGSTPSGFDCSGFTQYVYAKFGINLPRSSSAQSGAGYRVSAAEARPGDLVWWPGHIGIYTGNGNHIAARNPGTPLTEGPIYNSSVTYIRVG